MKFKENEYWAVLLLGIVEAITLTLAIVGLSALTSCNHKALERITHDTLTIVRSDTLYHTDTLRQVITITGHDSTAMERKVLQVVDTTGKVIKEYIYQDRIIYKEQAITNNTKDYSSTSISSASQTKKVNQSEETIVERQSKRIKYILSLIVLCLVFFGIYRFIIHK